jgi:hypothetical protein
MSSTHDLKANEFLFDRLLNSPQNYGINYFNNACVAFKKVGDKLTANSDDMEKIKMMVSKEYFDKTFIPLENGK